MDKFGIQVPKGIKNVIDLNKKNGRNAFLYGKTKEKVYITAGPEFGTNLHGKNLIIDPLLDFKSI
jgi:hypothetical protein